MFFAKRRYALRLIEEMEEPVSSPLATELVAMIIQGAKQYEQMHHAAGARGFSDAHFVMLSALAIAAGANHSANMRIIEVQPINYVMTLARLNGAITRYAAAEGLSEGLAAYRQIDQHHSSPA